METHDLTCQQPDTISTTTSLSRREQHIRELLAQGCHDTNGQIRQIVATGDGLRIVRPLLGPRFRQGV